MPAILKNEWKSGWKSLLIWALSVGGMGLIPVWCSGHAHVYSADVNDLFADQR